jgi:tRNA-uridine 2-sulfurtransferase
MSNQKTVVVGLSGGVDSSVSAYLLLQEGYRVIGIFMRNWNDESVVINQECPWVEDSNDALLVAEKLGIPFQVIDLSEIYKQRIVDYMFAEYERGRTPNPDVLCNREIKFDVFMQTAMDLGADYVATGHYCQKRTQILPDGGEIHSLIAGADAGKDQSYFLCQLSQAQLAKALFPIGHLQKSEVRAIAKAQDLITADKKDSQGLCFIGKVKLPVFLQQQLQPKAGDILQIAADAPVFADHAQRLAATSPDQDLNAYLEAVSAPYIYTRVGAKMMGKHTGAHYFTIGQRKGLDVGGTPLPLFIIATDTKENIVFVGMGDSHAGLWRKALKIPNADIHWIRTDLELQNGQKMRYDLRIRYRQALTAATLYKEKDALYIVFDEAQRGVTPGQFAAWYAGDELIGSGVID